MTVRKKKSVLDSSDLKILEDELNHHHINPISSPATPRKSPIHKTKSTPKLEIFEKTPQIELKINDLTPDNTGNLRNAIFSSAFSTDENLHQVETVARFEALPGENNLQPSSNHVELVNPERSRGFKGKFRTYFRGESEDIHKVLPRYKIAEIDRLVADIDTCQLAFIARNPHSSSSFKSASVHSLNFSKPPETSFEEVYFLEKGLGTQSDLSYDLLVEHERGCTVFGYPLFSKTMLAPFIDPPEFTNQYGLPVNVTQLGRNTSTGAPMHNLALYPLEQARWKWKWDRWHVLMIGPDTDDQGWVYSGLRFGSKHWTGKYRFGNSVRKRFWIRVKEPRRVSSEGQLQQESVEMPRVVCFDFYKQLAELPIDRLKIELILQVFLEDKKDYQDVRKDLENQEQCDKVMTGFMFRESIDILKKQLKKHEEASRFLNNIEAWCSTTNN